MLAIFVCVDGVGELLGSWRSWMEKSWMDFELERVLAGLARWDYLESWLQELIDRFAFDTHIIMKGGGKIRSI